MGLENLPKDKWSDTGEQPILKDDFVDIEEAILSLASRGAAIIPTLYYNDATSVRVKASTDAPISVAMAGYPNVTSPRYWIDFGSDGKSRENTSDADMDFDTSTTFWGNEKNSQWYSVCCVAADVDTTFSLKAMPCLRVKSQASQTISLGTNLAPGTGIGYGWATDSLAGYKLYFLSGASIGLVREVSANNNDNSTGGTITYTGSALTVAEGDWFMALPHDVNFRWIGDFYNNGSGNIQAFYKQGHRVSFSTAPTTTLSAGSAGWVDYTAAYGAPPLAVALFAYGYCANAGTYHSVLVYDLDFGLEVEGYSGPVSIYSTKIQLYRLTGIGNDNEYKFIWFEYPNALG